MAVQELFKKVLGDGARASKFDLIFQFAAPSQHDTNEENVPMLVKATQFPAKGHRKIDFLYKGRNIPIRGQVAYNNEWRCTFYLTEDHALKRAFENWIEALDETVHFNENLDDGVDSIIDHFAEHSYTSDIKLYQVSFDESVKTSQYVLYNVFPVEVSPIDVSYESSNEILTFDVTFAYSHFSEEVAMIGSIGSSIDGSNFGIGNTNFTNSSSITRIANVPNSPNHMNITNYAGIATSSDKTFNFKYTPVQSKFPAHSIAGKISSWFSSPQNSNASASNSSFINMSILKNGLNTVKSGISTASNTISDFTRSTQIIAGQVRNEFNSLIQPLTQISSEVKGYINGVNQMKNEITNTIATVKNGINQVKNIPGSLKSQAQGAINSLKNL